MDKYEKELLNIIEKRLSYQPIGIAERIAQFGEKTILFYGAGAFGLENLNLFRKYGVSPFCFLDKNAEPNAEKDGVPVFHPESEKIDQAMRKTAIVFITITIPKNIASSIKEYLIGLGYADVRQIQTVTPLQIRFENCEDENPDSDYITANREKILQAYHLMADEESKATFVSSVRSHFMREYDDSYETDFSVQYFDTGVPLTTEMTCFVDCGAYNGDSFLAALKKYGRVENYIAFEPIITNFTILSETVDKFAQQVGKSFLYPCGLSDSNGSVTFSVSASSSAIVTDGTGEILPIVKFDDVVKNVAPTYIKMDIEGAEIAAIKGCEQTIKKYSPELAISVYHLANHYWDIPCLIHSIYPNYKYYMRAHTAGTLETVLYCVEF